jgi:hypothetical protein
VGGTKSKLNSSPSNSIRSEMPLGGAAAADSIGSALKKRKSSPTAASASAGKRRMTDPEEAGGIGNGDDDVADDESEDAGSLDQYMQGKKDMVQLNRQRSRRKPTRKGTYTKSKLARGTNAETSSGAGSAAAVKSEAKNPGDEATVIAVPRPTLAVRRSRSRSQSQSQSSTPFSATAAKGPLASSRHFTTSGGPGTPSRVGSLAANFERGGAAAQQQQASKAGGRTFTVGSKALATSAARKTSEDKAAKGKSGSAKPIAALERAKRLKATHAEKEARRAASKAERLANQEKRAAAATADKVKLDRELEATREIMRKQRVAKNEKLKADALRKKADTQELRQRAKDRATAAEQKRKQREDEQKLERDQKKAAEAERAKKDEVERKRKQEEDRNRQRQLETERKQAELLEAERKQAEVEAAEAAEAAAAKKQAEQAAADRQRKQTQLAAERERKQGEIKAKQEAQREEMRKIQEAKKQLELKKRELQARIDLANRKQSERIKVPTIPDVAAHSSAEKAETAAAREAPPSPAVLQTYDMSHLDSDASTDEEDAPRSEVPPWASGKQLRTALFQQYINEQKEPEERGSRIFDDVRDPDMSEIFPTKGKSRVRARTSSAMWSPSPTKGNAPHKRF